MKTFQPFNLHSHTKRCGHASGEDEEYVIMAMETGFQELGFSDHIMLPGISQPGIRGDYSLLDEYLSSVASLKKKYAGRIQIEVGFEAEWYGDTFRPYYEKLLRSKKVRYLILGQHCFLEDGMLHWYGSLPKEEGLRRYRDAVIEGIESGLFTYVCHPDTYIGWYGCFDDAAKQAAVDICLASKRNNVPLEINCGPARSRLPTLLLPENTTYPHAGFWEVASEIGVPCILGVDAHSPTDYARTPYEFFAKFIQDHHLQMVEVSPLTKKTKFK